MKSISFDRLKQLARENIEHILRCRVRMEGCIRLVIAEYLDSGRVLHPRRDVMERLLPDMFRKFIDGCDVRCVGDLLSLVPQGTDNRIPAWVYGRTVAYMDDETWKWMLAPEEAA